MSISEPKKIKEQLAKIKQAIDAVADDDVVSAFRLLLVVELTQRRTIVSTDVGIDDLLSIHCLASAGKSLLHNNYESISFPKQLVAGANAIAGVVAEKYACAVLLNNSKQKGVLDSSSSIYQNLINRCKEVSDTRFQIILQLAASSSSEVPPLEMSVLFLTISMGSYLRAAYFSNPDTPLMWKRSLDICIKLHSILRKSRRLSSSRSKKYPDIVADDVVIIPQLSEKQDYQMYHTIIVVRPLTNLIQIAESKGNKKRVAELSLRLVEGYICNLSKNDDDVMLVSWLDTDGKETWDSVSEVFIDDQDRSSKENEGKLIEKARKVLEKCDNTHLNNDDNYLITLYKMLNLRIELVYEEYVLKCIVEKRYNAVRNRSLGSGAISVMNSKNIISRNSDVDNTKEGISLLVSGEMYTMSLSKIDGELYEGTYDDSTPDTFAVFLRDHFLTVLQNHCDGNENNPPQIYDATCCLLSIQIKRLLLRAQAVSLIKGSKKCCNLKHNDRNNAWDALKTFVLKIILKLPSPNSSSKAQRFLIEISSQALLTVSWMLQELGSQVGIDHLQQATKHLSVIRKEVIVEEEETRLLQESKEGKVLKVTASQEKMLSHEVKISSRVCGEQSGKCILIISQLGSNDMVNETITNAQNISTTLSHTESSNLARFGTPFFQFLVCWSGLHQSPWSFCTITQARSIIRRARDNLTVSRSEWGRDATSIEIILLDLGQADAEGGQVPGGFGRDAVRLYKKCLEVINIEDCDTNAVPYLKILRSHCLLGMSRLALAGAMTDDKYNAENCARLSMDELKLFSISSQQAVSSSFYHWRNTNFCLKSLDFHVCLSRELVAESLLRSGKEPDAQNFLEDAVKDFPSNYGAVFALGAFWLRMSFYTHNILFNNLKTKKKAQQQLLRAAKLDSTQANPFSLLGIWYEIHDDVKRAIGCFSKALALDPAHAIAGRGLLRLSSYKDVAELCKHASISSSSENGWAWRVIGETSTLHGDDEFASLCFQQALRSRDIEKRQKEALGIFYEIPVINKNGNISVFSQQECGKVWSDLGSCYRRLGKYTASLRSFQTAFEMTSGNLPKDTICAWATVELELGLFDEAGSKFSEVLHQSTSYNAAFGLASSMLSLARRDIEFGKAGNALNRLEIGINSLLTHVVEQDSRGTLTSTFVCPLKLLGDLYSFGASLSSSVFINEVNDSTSKGVELKLDFVSKGEKAYNSYLLMVQTLSTTNDRTDSKEFISYASYDLGINILFQARILCESLNEGSGGNKTKMRDIPLINENIKSLLEKSKGCFMKAIDSNELASNAWNGLGCVLCSMDPLLAQHSFSRALQLDRSSQDAWGNIALLYREYGILDESESAIDALTQITDTPVMWIGRGMLLEKSAIVEDPNNMEDFFCRAADAYRASLQVSRHPSALLGLSLTSRRLQKSINTNSVVANDITRKESCANMIMYLDSLGGNCSLAKAIMGIMNLEEGEVLWQCGNDKGAFEMFQLGAEQILEAGNQFKFEETSFSLVQAEIVSSTKSSYFEVKQPVAQNVKCSAFFQKEVFLDPEDGEMWLLLAKKLAEEYVTLPNADDQTYDLVLSTIRKAKQMLSIEATKGITLCSSSNTITSSMLSDAIALFVWLQDMKHQTGASTANESVMCSSIIDIQKALLLDPENRFVRAKIESFK